MIVRRLFNRRWLATTLLVILAVGVMIRLGVWQLDRLHQRRAFNARVEAQIAQPELDLNASTTGAELASMEYRKVSVKGKYIPSGEVALRNQAWQNQIGVHLITPLKITGTDRIVLVDRGWISYEDFSSGDWSKFSEPGMVEVHGVIRNTQQKPRFSFGLFSNPSSGQGTLPVWSFIDIPAISDYISMSLLPIYVQQAPDPAWTGLPYRSQPDLELTEGPHMGYALQWFSFAALLGLGYPFYVRHEESNDSSDEKKSSKNLNLKAQNQYVRVGERKDRK
jgi:surfeit locus 1 family protein